MSGKIFMSYRRGDSGHAGRLCDRLRQSFDPAQLFFDVDSVAPGLNFLTVIIEEMAQSAVLLVVIGDRWIDSLNRKTLEDSTDYVRKEIELALDQRKRIIPVLVGDARMPGMDQLPESLRSLALQSCVAITHERYRSDTELLIDALKKILSDTTRPEAPAQKRDAKPVPERRTVGSSSSPLQGFRDSGADDLARAAAGANRSARKTYANVPPVLPEADWLKRGADNRNADPDPGYSYDESADEAARWTPPPEPTRAPPERHTRHEKRQALHAPSSGFPFKSAIAIGVVILAGAAVLWGPALYLSPRSMSKSSPVVEAPKGTTTAPLQKENLDRLGQRPSSETVAPVVQRVVLDDEDPSDPKGKQYVGTVVWRTEQTTGSGNAPGDLAVRADIDIPDRKFKMTMLFRRNTDSSLATSQFVELTFILPKDFAGGGVFNVPAILMNSNEQARGMPLAGLAAKVTDGVFLVGLSNVDSDRSRNLQLLKERTWFDIPLVYANQRRAIIAIEKGAPGERAFQDAFAAWGE
jgi:hypothetical protein